MSLTRWLCPEQLQENVFKIPSFISAHMPTAGHELRGFHKWTSQQGTRKKQRIATWNGSDQFLKDCSQGLYHTSIVTQHQYDHIDRQAMPREWFVYIGVLRQLSSKWQGSICMLSSQGSIVWMALLSAQEEQYSHSSYSGHNDLLFIGSWKSRLSNCQTAASFH